MRKVRRKVIKAAAAELPSWQDVQNPPPADRAFLWMRSGEGAILSARAGAPLPPEADWWHAGAGWVRVVRGDPIELPDVPPSVPFTLDDDVPGCDPPFYRSHALVASRNLIFAWVDPAQPLPCRLDHPAEPQAVFYRVDLTFLSWMRGVCKRALDQGAAFTPEQQKAVNRVWSHVCHLNGIVDTAQAPTPGAKLPEEISESVQDSVPSGV